MSKTELGALAVQHRVAKHYGIHLPGAVEKAYAGTRYDSRIPLHVWAMVAIGVVGFFVIWFTR